MLCSVTIRLSIRLVDIIRVEGKYEGFWKDKCKGVDLLLSTSILHHCCSMNLSGKVGKLPSSSTPNCISENEP